MERRLSASRQVASGAEARLALRAAPHDTGSCHCPSLVVPSHAGERGWVGSASPASEPFVSGARAEERGLKTQPGTGGLGLSGHQRSSLRPARRKQKGVRRRETPARAVFLGSRSAVLWEERHLAPRTAWKTRPLQSSTCMFCRPRGADHCSPVPRPPPSTPQTRTVPTAKRLVPAGEDCAGPLRRVTSEPMSEDNTKTFAGRAGDVTQARSRICPLLKQEH